MQTLWTRWLERYVGGITGYRLFSTFPGKSKNWIMASTAMYLDMIMSAVSSAMQLSSGARVWTIRIQMAEMNNYVIGCSYVGGVIGANADIDPTKTQEDTGNSSGMLWYG